MDKLIDSYTLNDVWSSDIAKKGLTESEVDGRADYGIFFRASVSFYSTRIVSRYFTPFPSFNHEWKLS